MFLLSLAGFLDEVNYMCCSLFTHIYVVHVL
jgi:hypothetical protein